MGATKKFLFIVRAVGPEEDGGCVQIEFVAEVQSHEIQTTAHKAGEQAAAEYQRVYGDDPFIVAAAVLPYNTKQDAAFDTKMPEQDLFLEGPDV